ncbi:MAG TPA: TetR family transcriptional regulator [Polyangiales bacterium]|jgi:AcrR family transcriptional regulator|nr:TetR family transcriptional regulator [Polyangiales bacterium]
MDKDRKDRILDVAVGLAAAGGYENVRQRDVADQAGIALGTLYKSFTSKEHILSAALAREADELERRLNARPPQGDTQTERLQALFKIITRAMCHKPKYARAVLRAMASGQPEVAAHVTAYQGRMNAIIGSAMAGDVEQAEMDNRQLALATLLQQIWFASLVAWSAGIFSQTDVTTHMNQAIELILASPKARGLQPVLAR